MNDFNELVKLRRILHQHAELAGCEHETRSILLKALARLNPDHIISPIAGTGFAAIYDSMLDGPTVLLRAEMDALPVKEETGLTYRSVNRSVSHCCGHDGHMVVLVGVAQRLHRQRHRRGRVVLLFQPAEETGQGADAVVKDNRFAALAPDVVFALHNLPGYDQGALLVKAGVMNCASAGMKVRWKGQAAHASQPENSISPAQPIASLIRQWPQLAEAPVVADQDALVTIVHATLGEPSFGIIPGTGQLWATLRCESDAGLEQLMEASRHLVDISTKHLDLEVQVTVHDHFIATQNDPLATTAVAKAAENLGLNTIRLQHPLRWSEDFGRFTVSIPGAIFAIGAGKQTAPLHRPEYDFPDQLIKDGVALFLEIIRGWIVT